MPPFAKDLVHAGFSLLFRIALVSLTLCMVWLDIAVYHTQILELSFVEVTQEVMLVLCAAIFWTLPAAPGHAGFKTLAGGFFACLLMRELDGLFDYLSHSAWCWPFTAIACYCVSVCANARNRSSTLADLAAFTRTPAFGGLLTGFSVLLFSRVFGMGSLWHLILGEGYARVAKTTIEEGIELLAYSMWLATSVEFYLLKRAKRATPRHVVGAATLDVKVTSSKYS